MTAPSAPSAPLRALRWAVATVVVIIGTWAGARLHATHPAVMQVPVGEASPPTPRDLGPAFDTAAPVAVQIPERLPDFSLSDTAGKATAVSTWAGRSLILNFWATWCAPCRREIPLLQAISAEWTARGVTVVGVAVDHRDPVVAYARDLNIAYPLLIGEEDALDLAARLGVATPVFPFTVFTDRRGEVVALFVGELHKPQANLILSVVQRLNEDQLPLTAARQTIADGLHALPEG